MNELARRIQRTYLTLLLGNTLAASFIWGINTLFLLDAGLSNLEAFAANAFFTAGMVVFEVPTGVVADTWGRRLSYLLGTLTLAASTLLYYLMWQVGAPFWAWAVVSMLIGLGFTFFSGAVEAWLVDALRYADYQGGLESVLGRGQMISGAAMLVGSVLGGIIAQATSLGMPFLLRVGVLLTMFVVAHRLMKDLGFTPEPVGNPLRATRKVLTASIEYGLKNSAGALHDACRAIRLGCQHLHLLRAAAIPPRSVRRPEGILRCRPRRGHCRRVADPRRLRRAEGPPPVQEAHQRIDPQHHRGHRGPGAAQSRRRLLARPGAGCRLGADLLGRGTDPAGLFERHHSVEAAGYRVVLRIRSWATAAAWSSSPCLAAPPMSRATPRRSFSGRSSSLQPCPSSSPAAGKTHLRI